MVMDSANAIIFILLAIYNLFQVSKDAVKANQLQDIYYKNYYLHTM